MKDPNNLFPDLEKKFFHDLDKSIQSGTAYMDAIITWCGANDIEVEFIAAIIAKNSALKAKLQLEAEDLHFLKRTVRLPI